MNRKVSTRITALLAILLLCTMLPVSADEWEMPVPLDPHNNPLFTIVKEISEEKYNNFDKSLSPVTRDDKYVYNDGLKTEIYDYEEPYYTADGEEKVTKYPVRALADINGKRLFDNPIPQTAAAAYSFTYNLGYVCERDAEYDFMEDKFNSRITFTNVFTGKTYYFDTIDCHYFFNDGSLYLEMDGKYYKAMLKKPAIPIVHLNGKKLYFDQIPVIENGRTLVPLRAIFEALGANITWDEATRTVRASKGSTNIKLTIDKTTAYKNGKAISLDVPAKIVGGRTLVPVRFIADAFGVSVDWNDALKDVILTTK